MNWYVIKKNNKVTLSSDWLLVKKETYKESGSLYRKFEHFDTAIDYIKNNCEDLPIDVQVSINDNDYTRTLFIDFYFNEENNKYELKAYDEKFNIYLNELKELLKDEYEFSDKGNIIFIESDSFEYNQLLTFLISIELGEYLNCNRIIYNKFPEFIKDRNLGFAYNELVEYCLKTKKEIKSKIILKESDLFDDFNLFF